MPSAKIIAEFCYHKTNVLAVPEVAINRKLRSGQSASAWRRIIRAIPYGIASLHGFFLSIAALTVATGAEFPCGFAGLGGGGDALHPELPNPTVVRLKAVLCDRSDGLNEMMLK